MAYGQKRGIVFTLPSLFEYNHENFPACISELTRRPGVRPILKRLRKEGYKIILIASDDEEFKGLRPDGHTLDTLSNLQTTHLEECPMDQIYFELDPHTYRYIPCSGMIRDLLTDFKLAASEVLFVGYTVEDMACARSANVDFVGSSVFFNTLVPKQI